MKKITLLVAFLCTSLFVFSQSGNTLPEAINTVDNNQNSLASAFNGLNASSLTPYCFGSGLDPKIDLFYKNTIETDHDIITFNMTSQIGVIARIYFQISRAIGGDENNLVEVVCDYYDINTVPLGGSMDIELPSITYTNGIVNPNDVYFIRIFRPTDQVGVDLDQTTVDAILSNTTLNMNSFDSSTLSLTSYNIDTLNSIVTENSIKIINNQSFKNFKIYSIDGKLIKENSQNNFINNIDISTFNRGIYILHLENNESSKVIKFLKQ
ncbi:T9SS type A sorting domain-containing protein [Olleya aquimaris]|uniref:Putative secreted protein (Por secretion system target) n=1 Tax=Olleya aquimaris TaxID=639310 RepID=A0A327RJA4_9FLAO|nr:T9SS type A sorting domain-containing protein [Olleya aquimaris]RAJ17206.1 putative secreted protein (Por secretion system target) [Olleya aquimaris]